MEQWLYGNRSILSGLVGAYLGALIAKRLVGYKERTGDLFAPAVALGMAIGRIGCLLTELPGTPTALPWGGHADARAGGPRARTRSPASPLHPSFAYEIVFQLAAFAALLWLRGPARRAGRAVHAVPGRVRRLPFPGRVRPGQRGRLRWG